MVRNDGINGLYLSLKPALEDKYDLSLFDNSEIAIYYPFTNDKLVIAEDIVNGRFYWYFNNKLVFRFWSRELMDITWICFEIDRIFQENISREY